MSLNAADAPTHNRYISNLGSITSNRFYRDQQHPPNVFVRNIHKSGTHTTIPVTWSGNVYDVNNASAGFLTKFF